MSASPMSKATVKTVANPRSATSPTTKPSPPPPLATTTAASSSSSTATTPATTAVVPTTSDGVTPANATVAELTNPAAKNAPELVSSSGSNSNLNSSSLNNVTNGSLSDSLVSTEGNRTPNVESLSKTNLYIRGLSPSTTDQDLYNMCARFGDIFSTKAILANGVCKGYGFVQFNSPQSAELAVQELTKSGVQAQMARISTNNPSHNHNQNYHNNQYHHNTGAHHPNNNNNHQHHHHHHNNLNQQHHHHQQHHNNSGYNHNSNNHNLNNHVHSSGSSNSNHNNNNNADPTNLYIANLPLDMNEQELENLLSTYGPVVSTRILRDQISNSPRGVGFARMESRDKCQEIIEKLNGKPCKGSKEPLLVKFADGGSKKRHHHNNHHHNNNNNHHHHHHKLHQEDSRWRESNNQSGDLSTMSNYEPQGNISTSNQLPDLAIMSSLSYPRIQPAFPPPTAPGVNYPTSMGQSTGAPQWIHPGTGQPWNIIPQQMMQPGGMNHPSNQAAAAAAPFPYSHISHLTSQMQGLQIAHHPGAPVGGYLPPQHQWPAMWPHPMASQQAPQASMRLATPIQAHPPPQQQQQPPQQQQQQQQHHHHHHHHVQGAPTQQSPQPQSGILEPPNNQKQQHPVVDTKLQVSSSM